MARILAQAEVVFDLFPGEAEAPAFSARELRDAFGCFATGVTIVTAAGPQGPVGLTVNSFSSVSLDPPLLLFCIDRRTGSLPVFEAAEAFAVNVLGADHQGLAAEFARRGVERFTEARWATAGRDLPILPEATAVFECRRYAVHDGGDHRIFVGRIERLRRVACDPLVVFQGSYLDVQARG